MRGRLHPEQVRRLADLALAQRLAASGYVASARAIFARYGIAHVAVEINHTVSVKI